MRGPLCVTAHPDGCARNVEDQIRYVRAQPPIAGPRRVLVIGSSNGLGLSTRICAAFGAGAATIGVCLERPGTPVRTATPGWYTTAAFEHEAAAAGLAAATVVGDAFTDEVKARTIDMIRREMGAVDLVVYSVAAPRRRDPATGALHISAIKSIGEPFTGKSYDFSGRQVRQATLAPASEQEIKDTVAVMGGEDWALWLRALHAGAVLAQGATTLAFSYQGQRSLAPTYRGGTMGRAKEHLEATARRLEARYPGPGLRARVAVMKALVTQSSAAIPMSTLYTIVLFKVMRELNVHEGPVEQAYRLLADRLYAGRPCAFDPRGRIRLDDLELREDVQAQVNRRLAAVTTANLAQLGDPQGFHDALMRIYGFAHPRVDYDAQVDPVRAIPSVAVS
jgi:enoyl-[acyl-carrier protein] reductase/trans-2-enoyl-CoA reductase (NAD+)